MPLEDYALPSSAITSASIAEIMLEVEKRMARTTRWEVTSAPYRSLEFHRLLREGWEPFSSTRDEEGLSILLRRPVIGEG